MSTQKEKAWDYALGIIKVDGLEPSPEFLELVEKEKRGEITTNDIIKTLNEKGGITIPENQSIKLTRELLYKEIWEISVTGVAKKYNAAYAELLKLCKEKDIPIPPSGYWTKLSFGKPVIQTPLPESPISVVTLPANYTPKRSKRSAANDADTDEIAKTQQAESSDMVVKTAEQTEVSEKHSVDEVPDVPQDDQLTYHAVSGVGNTYNRQKLYGEVWAKPIVEVAVQYGVSDVAIHKVCKSLNVPVPPRGYWARFRAGEKLKKPPLPATDGIIEKTGARTFDGIKEAGALPQLLGFLTESERQKVLLAAQQIHMPAENAQLNKRIIAYKSVVKEWNNNNTRPDGAERSTKNYSKRPPFLAGIISNETLTRVYRILDALFRQIESLGGSVNDDLSLQIRNEQVYLELFEGQDQKKRKSGHYCKICSAYKSNESFSGKGHANHICKRCSKKSPTEQAADMTLKRLFNMPFRKLSPAEKSWLENRLHDQREEVKSAAQEIYKHLYPHAERNNRKKQLNINKLCFRINSKVYEELRDVQNANCLFEADKVSKKIVKTVFASNGSPTSRQEKFMLDSDMAKLLKWIVHSLEIFEWEQDYGKNNNIFNFLSDDQLYSDEFDCFEECVIGIEKEVHNVEQETITWHVEVNYSDGTIQKTSGTYVYLPEKVEALYWGFQEFFTPAYSEEEECEEDMELQGGIDELPF